MKIYLTISFLILIFFQTVAESRCISGENFDFYGAASQMRREAQIEHRVSDFDRFYQEYSQEPDFSPLRELSQRFNIKEVSRILIMENDINLSNTQIMVWLIPQAIQSLICFLAHQYYNYQNEEYLRLYSLINDLNNIYQYFLNPAQSSSSESSHT